MSRIINMNYYRNFEAWLNETKNNTLILYHGTDYDFEKFDLSEVGKNTDNPGWNGYGIYFSDTKTEAKLYGKNIITVEVILNKPFDLTDIDDTSIQGSGLIKILANTEGLKDLKYKGKTYFEWYSIIKELENNFDADYISLSNGTNDNFKHVWYRIPNQKEYVFRNLTEPEYSNTDIIMGRVISEIISDLYDVDNFPIRIKDVGSFLFTQTLIENGYDGVIAPNSNSFTGNEYVIFNPTQIRII